MGSKPYHREDVLRELYCEEDMGIEAIAEKFDVAESTIWTWLDKNDIETTPWESAEERFENRYEVDDDTGCWEWTGSKDDFGYGSLSVDGESIGTHRFSYEIHKGEIPNGAMICHKCHNPGCVNPDHLYAGDAKSNAQDAIDNEDWPRQTGEKTSTSALSAESAKNIRELYANGGMTVSELSNEFDVSTGTISRIINGDSYPNAGGPVDIDTHERMAKRGSEQSNTNLTESDVMKIRQRYESENISMADLGSDYDVSASCVCGIVNRDTWDHVE